MAAQTQRPRAIFAKFLFHKDADTRSMSSADTILLEKEGGEDVSKSTNKKRRFFGSRSGKSEKGEEPRREMLESPQEVIDEVYRRYPLAALSTPHGSRGFIF